MSPIYDFGPTFDGKCCVCREWIHPGEPVGYETAPEEVAAGCDHTVAHARCTEGGRRYIEELIGRAQESLDAAQERGERAVAEAQRELDRLVAAGKAWT